jgi:hypothetical protein
VVVGVLAHEMGNGDVRVDLSGRGRGVAEQLLNFAQARASLQ